jgi:hypothetical protein
MKFSKKLLITSIVSLTGGGEYAQCSLTHYHSTNLLKLPRFIHVKKNNGYQNESEIPVTQEIDLLKVFQGQNLDDIDLEGSEYTELIEFAGGFYHEEYEVDLIEFDDDSITVPIEIFRDHPSNGGDR